MGEKRGDWDKELNQLKCLGFILPDNVLIRNLENSKGNMSIVIQVGFVLS